MSDQNEGADPGSASAAEETAPPADELEQLRAEVAELKDRLLRAVAEMENIRKRAERERAEAAKYSIANFARDLTAVADNLSRALQAIPMEQRAAEPLSTLVAGVELTERELVQAFERHQVHRIDPKGEPFNPHFHQAVAEIPNSGAAPGTVVEVIQPGYAIGDRLVRAAMVVVAGAQGDARGANVDTKA